MKTLLTLFVLLFSSSVFADERSCNYSHVYPVCKFEKSSIKSLNEQRKLEYENCVNKVKKSIKYQNCLTKSEEQKKQSQKKLDRMYLFLFGLPLLGLGILIKNNLASRKKRRIKNDSDDTIDEPNNKNTKEKKYENPFSSIFSNNKNDIQKRLAKLKKLLDDNQITKEEYEEQRKKIIGDV